MTIPPGVPGAIRGAAPPAMAGLEEPGNDTPGVNFDIFQSSKNLSL
jgi:hypothetical protein